MVVEGRAGAQPVAIPRIAEADLVAALGAHPRSAVLRVRIAAARAEITAARALPNPALGYEREAVFVGGAEQPEEFLRASIPLDLSGRRGRRIAAVEAGAAAVTADAERDAFLLRLDAIELFHDTAQARLRAETLRQDRGALQAIVDRLRARAAAGDASGYDLTRLELELGEHDDLVAQADRELAVHRRSLGLLAGRKGLVDAGDSLEVRAGTSSPGREDRPDRRAADRRLAEADAELAAARRAWVPTLELSGGVKSIETEGERRTGYLVGLTAQLPFFEHGQGDRARAEARREAALAESRLLDASIPVQVQSARDVLARSAAQAARYQETQVPRAESLLRRAESLHREGERPVFELVDAYRTMRQVRLRALDLRRQARRDEVALWRALGRRS